MLTTLLTKDDDEAVVVRTVATLLRAALFFHVTHLLETTHAAHVVLGDIYVLCQNSADRLFEEQSGRGFNLSALSPYSQASESFRENPKDPLMSMDSLLLYLSSVTANVQDLQLKSTFEDLRSSFYRQNYLLKLTKPVANKA